MSIPEEKRRSLQYQYQLLLALSSPIGSKRYFGKANPPWAEIRKAARMAIRHAPTEYEFANFFVEKDVECKNPTEVIEAYLASIKALWEPYTMTDEEVAYFASERDADFVPLMSEQTRLLPVRNEYSVQFIDGTEMFVFAQNGSKAMDVAEAASGKKAMSAGKIPERVKLKPPQNIYLKEGQIRI